MPTVSLLVVWMLSTEPNGNLVLNMGHNLHKDKATCGAQGKEFLKEQPNAQFACLKTNVVGKQV
ncbi:hypothetical protein D3C87_905790 [compost metagenome]